MVCKHDQVLGGRAVAGEKSRDAARQTSVGREVAPGRPRPVTMRDIARATNLSQSTVSRVLTRTPTPVPIAEATRQRVTQRRWRWAIDLPPARGLRGASTMLLGLIVRDITDPFFAGPSKR